MSEEGNINIVKGGEKEKEDAGKVGPVNDKEDLGENDLLKNQDLEKEEHPKSQDSVEKKHSKNQDSGEKEHLKNQDLGKMEHLENQTDDEKQGNIQETEEGVTEVKICKDSELKSDISKAITDFVHTPMKDKSHKDNEEDETETESTVNELNETDQDSDEKFLSSVESNRDAEVKFRTSSETDKESDTVSNGFEIVPQDSLQIPFTHYVDHRNLTHSGKSAHSAERTDHENELVRLLKLYRTSNKDLKDFHRRNPWGTHDTIRGQLWVRVCETLHKAKGNLYDDYEKDLFHQRNTDDLALPPFVDFNNLTSYHLSEQGTKTVAKILAVIQNTNPEILYCPTLYAKLSIFLHYMGPSDAFNCIYALLRSKDANIMQTKVAVESSKLVLRDLTKKYAKSAYVYLVRNCNDVTAVFDSWMWWLFSDLPFPHIVRIIDCYLVEGVKVLYRIVLSILILFTKYSVSAKHHGVINDTFTVGERIQQFCTNMPFPVEKLLKRGFRIRGLTKKEIQKLQLRHEMCISSQHHLQHELQKSASSHSFGGLPHSHSFSGRIVFDQTTSSIVTSNEMLYTIWSWLPARYAVCQPELLYTSEEHGTSLRTLYTRIENHQPTLILIKTTTDEVFGAFCSMYWRERKKSNKNVYYFGTGETFVFTLSPERKKYEWVGLHEENVSNTANMFLAGDSKILTIGGGNGEAIQLDENLLHCRTEHCDTFDNPPLCSDQDFTCKVVEVYGFQ